MSISPARRAALSNLEQIESTRAFSSTLLAAADEKLDVRDRALCHELTLGVLRRRIKLDAVIDSYAGGRNLDRVVRNILRIALYQLFYLDRVPPHAAINDAVNMTHAAKKTSAKGFVNAILRRSQRENPPIVFADETGRVSVETSHPRWLIERWTAQFGLDAAVAIAEADNVGAAPAFRFTAKTTDSVRQAVARQPEDFGFLRELAANGKIYFQDAGSQLVGDAVGLRDGESFLDVCAAPGSKTTQIAAAAPGALIVAADVSASRVALLAETCARQGVANVAVVRCDAASALPFDDGAFDAVLVDAPCSGTGTIRHNPEIRYFLSPDDFSVLQAKQLAILERASKLVKRGGRLIYSTCSLEREENEDVCFAFLGSAPEFGKRPPRVSPQHLTPEGFARTSPADGVADGFFIAEFVRASE